MLPTPPTAAATREIDGEEARSAGGGPGAAAEREVDGEEPRSARGGPGAAVKREIDGEEPRSAGEGPGAVVSARASGGTRGGRRQPRSAGGERVDAAAGEPRAPVQPARSGLGAKWALDGDSHRL